ncbi:hypothetical protein EBZ39_04305 [bacterium]|nr:hypothetical protein [bacterium]
MADGAASVCVCVLFYGAEDKHFKLAQRVLNEPMRELAARNVSFRFGCNAVGPDTTQFLVQQIADYFHSATIFHSAENLMKYPMMRRMLYEPAVREPITMWFDHDSYLEPTDGAHNWLDRVITHVNGCNLVGSVERAKLPDEQLRWIEQQPWFNPEYEKTYLPYVIGGWWAIKTELLYQFNFPPAGFQQKYGERVLGAAFKHQDIRFCHFREGVKINVNDSGVETAAPRTMTA